MPMDEIVSRYYRAAECRGSSRACWQKSPQFSPRRRSAFRRSFNRKVTKAKVFRLILMLHDAPNAAMRKALAKIAKLPPVKAQAGDDSRGDVGITARSRQELPFSANSSLSNRAPTIFRSLGCAADPGISKSMALIVQKYGGTSVGNPERIKNVAARVAKYHAKGDKIVVVVSAMSGVTDNLIKLAKEIMPLPNEREMDVLLATGEQTTIALTAIALHAIGIPGGFADRRAGGHRHRRRSHQGENSKHHARSASTICLKRETW